MSQYSDKDVRGNIRDYYDPQEMPGGWTFDHVKTLQRINRYIMSQYENGEYDPQGFYKFFYNITKVPRDIMRKFIDLDTKDSIFTPEKDGDEFAVFMAQRRFKQWTKDNFFAEFINATRDDLPDYGSSVGKRLKSGAWETVPLENLMFDTTVKSLDKSMFVYERHMMSKGDIEAMKWQDTEELFKRGPDENNKYVVYECYHKVGQKWQRTIKGDLYRRKHGQKRASEAEINESDTFLPSVVLDEREIDKLPYREVHTQRVRGRWLGLGVPELLFDAQVAVNEAENLEAKAQQFSALQIWQTRDETMGGENIFTSGVENGDVIKVEQEITKVDVADRNVASSNQRKEGWKQQAQELTHSNDVSRGELPSRTPVGTANIQLGTIVSFFDETIRENLGLYLKHIILDDVLPAFEKDTNKEHVLTFAGGDDELEALDNAIVRAKVNEKVVKAAMDTGFFPSQARIQEIEAKVRDQLNRQKNRYMKIPKGFYKNLRYNVDLITTGESVDVGAKGQILQTALQIIGTNPAIIQEPTTRKIFFKFLALGGISPVELGMINESSQQQAPMQGQMPPEMLPQGGSVSMGQPVAGMMPNVEQV